MEDKVRPKAVAKGSVGPMRYRMELTAEKQDKGAGVDDGLRQEASVVPVAGTRYQMEVHVGPDPLTQESGSRQRSLNKMRNVD